jgi:acyl-CoA thioester hydrolase
MRELWRGGVNTWECDEMGHMNVRFYVSRAIEAIGGLARLIGMPWAFRADAQSTLVPVDMHVRFHREAHAGAPLFARGGVVFIEGADLVAYVELVHAAGGEICATFRTVLRHVTARDLRPFPFSETVRAAALEESVLIPPHGLHRSIDPGKPLQSASHAESIRLGMTSIGACVVGQDMVDPFGRMRPECFMGRISDGVPNMLAGWRKEATSKSGARMGAAVLEYRLCFRAWPKAGDHLDLRSGVMSASSKTHALAHWVTDPVSGEAWCTSEALAVNFDLDARKVAAVSDEAVAELEKWIIPGLGA